MSELKKHPARFEAVDHRDHRWPAVLDLFDRLGQRGALALDADGWLHARQSVVVAFVDEKPAAQLSFHVHPVDRQHIEARLDSVGFMPATAQRELSRALAQAARQHAQTLRCSVFKGFGLDEPHKTE